MEAQFATVCALLRQAEERLRQLASISHLRILPPSVWNLSVEVQRINCTLDKARAIMETRQLPAVVPAEIPPS